MIRGEELVSFRLPEDALRAVVAALGGPKKVGAAVFPDKSVDAAARSLLDCLNADRHEKLTLSQWLLILRLAREAGIHTGMQWIAGALGYDVTPVSPAEEVDRLALVVEQSTKTLSNALAALERLQRGAVGRSAE
jgi:hypothetical protein